MTYVYWQLFYLPLILLALYAIGIQHQRGGAWRVLKVFLLPGVVLDIYLNYTTFALALWEKPAPKMYTFSKQVSLLQYDTGWRGVVAREVKRLLNFIAPAGYPHIP